MSWVLNQIFGGKVHRDTRRYVSRLASSPAESARRRDSELITDLSSQAGSKITLGETPSGETVRVSLDEIVKAYGLVTGGTGSGKSMFALLILEALIESETGGSTGFGVLDAKGDLFQGALYLLSKRLDHLARHDPKAARELRRRIVIYDFSARDPLSSYNILARWPNTEADFFALNRADLLLDLLPGSDKLSLGAVAVLQKLLLLLSEFSLPITYLGEALYDEALRNRLLARCQNAPLAAYFARQFASVPKSTIAALRRRAEALFSSEGMRLTLAGQRAPDFRRLQDEGKIVLINCFGETIARSVRRLLQALVLSDIRQSVFARRRRDSPYLWFCDEAQNFFLTEQLRDNMSDLLTMSRSFGSFFLYLTQNLATAVQDTRILRILSTNVRWSFSMRGEPSDCAFLKPALRVTGRKLRPQASPFEEKRFYTLSEERSMALDSIAHLPDRVGYLWFKARSAEALRIKTEELVIPQGEELEAAVRAIRRDPSIGGRVSRREYDRLIAERDREWEEEETELSVAFEQAYQNAQGGTG